jgi:hypothetical protein
MFVGTLEFNKWIWWALHSEYPIRLLFWKKASDVWNVYAKLDT